MSETPTEFTPPALLTYAAGVPGPIRLESTDGTGVRAMHEIPTPYALIGRGHECDIRVPDAIASFRHLYLQPIGRRLACLDLFTAGGVQWLEGPPFEGWLLPGHRFQIGSMQFRLLDNYWAGQEPLRSPLEFRPREEQAIDYGPLATVELELLNTSAQGKRWPINRIITLVGRDDRCRITVADERISRVHCALLLLPSGLWVIDLLGKGGTQFNGVGGRCGLLAEGVDLTVGPYKLAAHYLEQAAPGHAPVYHSVQITGIQGQQEFVTRQNRLFYVESFVDTMIVRPQGNGRAFFYQEVHAEASRVSDVILSRKYQHLVVDLSATESMGKLITDALSQMCRNTQGKAVFCNATPETYAELERCGLAKIWQHYLSLEDAYLAVHA
jgi:pSer/pThr/pTyr-binding forkhead associated (FHA) protein/anti-anti-sigma regulatory factor